MEAATVAPPVAKPKAAKAQAEEQGTPYVILEAVFGNTSDDVAWKKIGEATALTKDKAIDAVVGEKDGTFKGVPERSWKGATKRTAKPTVKVESESVDL